jgi:hypothetical protein
MATFPHHGIEGLRRATREVTAGLDTLTRLAVDVEVMPPLTVTAKIEGSKNINITALNILIANTEEAHVLQTNLKQLMVKNRNYVQTKVKFTSGGDFILIPSGTTFTLDNLDLSGATLYVEASAISTVEIVELF